MSTTEDAVDSSEGGETTEGPSDPGDPVMLTCPENPTGHDPLELIGTAEAGDASQFVAVVATEEHAFGCAEQGGLVVWSIVDPAAPTMVHGPTGDSCTALGLSEDQLAVARDGMIEWLDVSDPTTPVTIASGPFEARIYDLDVDIETNTIRAAAGTEGLINFAVEADTLAETSRFTDADSDARALVRHEDHLVVAEGTTGLRLYDPAAPSLVTTLPLEGTALDVALDGNRAWVATIEGASIAEINGETLTEIGTRATPGQALGITVGEGFAVIADWELISGISRQWRSAPGFVAAEPLPSDTDRPRTRAVTRTPAGRILAAGWEQLWVHGAACPPDAPSVFPDPSFLPFHDGEVQNGQTTRVLSIRNRGNRDLVVEQIIPPEGVTVTDEEGFVVAQGSAQAIEVTYDPAAGMVDDLIIVSDDPDQPEMPVEIAAGISGVAIGDPMVPLRAVDLEGRVWTEADMEGQVVLLAYFATW